MNYTVFALKANCATTNFESAKFGILFDYRIQLHHALCLTIPDRKKDTVEGDLCLYVIDLLMFNNQGTTINSDGNYNLETELNTDCYSDYEYSSHSPQTYNSSWYVREVEANGPTTTTAPENASCSCKYWKEDLSRMHSAPVRCNNLPQSAASIVASYGVYQDSDLRNADEEDGFVHRTSVYRGVVVNATGGSSVVRTGEVVPSEGNSCSWCVTTQSEAPHSNTEPSCWTCCKPTVLLIILVVLVLIFMLVSGILIYFNCTF
ncbi:hypothetical protein FQA39_LY00281 [Lamprigera yunnana]|nr:hypothetical protein FQA39_LY00281 [Lamprigera yunnana]